MISVAAGLGTLIFVHELGHFLVAKACGVKCEKFYIGFDVCDLKIGNIVIIPRSLFKFQWGETEYGLGILPLGGYVKMLGQDDNPANAAEETERTKIRKEKPETGKPDTDEQTSAEDQPQSEQEEFELDPRSYTSKTVPQRMAIISAGVIMNLIFAVIFGTFAYRMGVEYTPCEIGSTVAGGPAWKAGLLPGDKIIQIGKKGKPSEHLRFTWDLRNGVGMAGDQEDLDLLIKRGDDTEIWFSIRPKLIKIGSREIPNIGIIAVATTTLGKKQPTIEFLPAGSTKKSFIGGDKIVAITDAQGNKEVIKDYYQLRSMFARHSDEDLLITVEREIKNENGDPPKTVTEEIVVAPNTIKRLGLVMKYGPVSAVLPGSASGTKIKVGDLLKSIAGVSIDDPLLIPHLLRKHYGKQIEIEVARTVEKGVKKIVPLKITPESPADSIEPFLTGAQRQLSIPSLGIVLPITRDVVRVLPNSPAAKAGIEAGDKIVELLYESDDKETKEKLVGGGKKVELDDTSVTWLYVQGWLQQHMPESRLNLTYERKDSAGKIQRSQAKGLVPVPQQEFDPSMKDDPQYNPDRGFVFSGNSETHTAESFSEAVALGFRQTKEDALKIVGFLRKLATGGISPTNLGGPGTIAVVATMEASRSTSSLLMFLVLISANLAVVNFLPIPVLDGGHMLFLIAEGIRGKPLNEKLQVSLTVAGLFFVLGLMVFVIGLDVWTFSGLRG